MNGFTNHGIVHTSPSQINTWIASPCFWVMTKLFGKRYRSNFSMERGTAIERAVVNILANGMSEDEAIKETIRTYNTTGGLGVSEKKETERAVIDPSVRLLVQELKQYGEPTFPEEGQQAIKLNCKTDEWELPVIGYMDLVYPQHNLVIDLKSTLRFPSEMSMSHQRQAAIYATATGMDVKFLYVTPKKLGYLACEHVSDVMKQVKVNLVRQEKFLSISTDKNVLAGIVPVNCESYYYDTAEAIADRVALFGV